jgi:cardiolipin-specific phospholipase
MDGYTARRFPETMPHKKELSEYSYQNLTLDGHSAGAYGLFELLQRPPGVWAHRPLVDRVHKLRVPRVTFIYGDHDWMDYKAAVEAKRKCDENAGPECAVYLCPEAGHMLMMDAPENFVACLNKGVRDLEPADNQQQGGRYQRVA